MESMSENAENLDSQAWIFPAYLEYVCMNNKLISWLSQFAVGIQLEATW